MKPVALKLEPEQILKDPLLNKGSAFTLEERDALKLHGLLPFHVSTLEEQVQRRYENFCTRQDPLSRYIFLSALQNRNETLFYRLAIEHISEMLPLIYTPTVGEASLQFSQLFKESRGLYLSYPLKEKIPEILDRLPSKEIDVVVVTDGERILGLGDLGIGGMAIPVGKLALYTLFAGVHPGRVLPVHLDVGTNNPELLKDPLYLGWSHPRITGKEYDDFVHVFVKSLQKKYPKVLLQWEDFGREHARPLLDRYRAEVCSFNDDIQGTAATVLAAAYGAVRALKSQLKDQKIVLLGAGSAGLGICEVLIQAMKEEGLSEQEAFKRFYLVDIHGLIHADLESATPNQKKFAREKNEISKWAVKTSAHITLLEVVQNAAPTILIGVSTQAGAFTEEIVRAMADKQQHPIIFPLSNPTSKSEAHPQDLLHWTDGKALIATGSPFEPVYFSGKNIPIAQCNNVYIFPGVGLGVLISQAKKVTDNMFLAAAKILSEHAPLLSGRENSLFPAFESLREITKKIALGVALCAQSDGAAEKCSEKELQTRLDQRMWFPEYPKYTQ
jgi:malate dehydrogenase (oxaloacetate-decarboxylating)